MRASRWGLLWAALLTVMLTVGVTATILSTPSHADEVNLSESVQISTLSPEQYRVGDSLTVGVETALPVGSTWFVETFLQPTPFDSVWEMQVFLKGDGFPGWRLHSKESAVPKSGSLRWTIAAEEMPWPDAQTVGPRGLVVRFSDGKGSIHEARTALIYEPLEQYPQTRVNVLLTEDGTLDPRELGDLATRDGITIAAPTPELSAEENNPTRSPLHVALDKRGVEILSVPEAQSDASALAASGVPALLELSLGSRSSAEKAGYQKAAVIDNVVVSSKRGFNDRSLPNLVGNAIIAPNEWGDSDRWDQDITPTSRVEVDVAGNAMTVVDNWKPAADLLNAAPGSDADELTLRQTLRTLTLMTGIQDPDDQRTLFIRMGRGVDLDAAPLKDRLDALLDPDWVLPTSFSEVLTSTASEIPRPKIPSPSESMTKYSARVEPLEAEYQQAQVVLSATEAGSAPLEPFQDVVLAATSSRLKASTQTAAVRHAIQELKTITESIHVLPLSTVNMVHQDANFPLSVANLGDSAAEVRVSIESSDARLQAVESVNITVSAGNQVEVLVPVRAVGAGDVSVRAVVRTLGGQVIDDSQSVIVRVRPNWEDIGTLVVGVSILVLFIYGLIRSFRSAKRRSRS